MEPIDINIIRDAIENGDWKSYVIDWVQPVEHRLFTIYEGHRIMLQKFHPCDISKIYYHNHPWSHISLIVKGQAAHGISTSYNEEDYNKDIDLDTAQDTITDNQFAYMLMGTGSSFCIHSPKCWHYFYPLNDEPVYAIMMTGELWNKGPKAPCEIKELSFNEKFDIMYNVMQYIDGVK